MSDRPLLALVDGHYLFHRAYHAQLSTDRRSPSGEPVWAAYGFCRTLLTTVAERRPDSIAVAFDVSGPGRAGRRREKFPAYKANRQPSPPDLLAQLPLVRELVAALGLASYELDGCEADDVIGTIATLAHPAYRVEIVTGDRDFFQLVRDDGILVVMPPVKAREPGEPWLEVYDAEAVFRRMNVWPWEITALKGLAGDASDNIPGVPKVGEKTAITLIEQFGSFEAIYADDRELFKSGLRARLREFEALARQSLWLATIETSLPLDVDFADLRFRRPDLSTLRALLDRLGFDDLAAQFPVEAQF